MGHPAHAAACGTMTVRLESPLDPSAAARTLARIAELPCDDVVVDLAAAPRISDVALAFLAGGLSCRARSRVSLRGLDAPHEQLVRDLGAGSLVQRDR